jgi:hypothetical protein
VRYALKCDSAEQLAKALKRRWEHQQQRAAIAAGLPRQDGETGAELERLLADQASAAVVGLNCVGK